ncbi:ImmA/IrrE family metallo-endopeptidase [uncultured Pseudoalteromonas sp.]|uniref:ImmA/IrrE family metallo-endopeptidase n=1 Tax=uncultured Pseudoalteromonas sp. TaxID=114053 RepID=UPI000C58F7C9|nr:ImmA/IrrE family metallo-endopeptidase [uncultured Pseudoalteromonas sp.]MBD55350.1 hypothetical protein [Pseudoalteromonas sp.]|tara:strand:- start:1127 stop:1651 length:525 start_codon:yes stop_codon:yes gene_type:complete
MSFQRKLGHKVAPLSTATIEKSAREYRDAFQLNMKPRVNICALLEALQGADALTFEIVEDEELAEAEATTYPNQNRILIRNSVYEDAACGDGRARFTLAHEIGHLILHKNQTPAFSRGRHQVYEDSEWQADTFASEFLMDSRFIKENDDEHSLMEKFQVSYTAAKMKLKKLNKK